MTDKPVPEAARRAIAAGADERDLVYSGLDDTMRRAYTEIRTALDREGVTDRRTAAFVVAIEKIARYYDGMHS